MNAIIPIPKIPITVRPGTMDDVPFLDSLQKLHTKQVGWMPTKQFEGKIRLGHVLIAEEGITTDYTDDTDQKLNSNLSVVSVKSVVQPLGYCIGNDQYFKRDDVGIIYQMNVMPGRQRGLIGATLLKAMFDRAAYGCRLFCCWCAQDIEANYFWESMGFVPLAFRTGSAKKSRVHIFWQRRIRAGDTTTPYWFPSQTSSGSIREDRLVLPIPPGKSWRDEMPRVLPSEGNPKLETRNPKQITNQKSKIKNAKPGALGGWSFIPPKPAKPAPAEKKPRAKVKNDPRLVAATRELKDRWLEWVNENPSALVSAGKYEVSRALPEASVYAIEHTPRQLPAAA